MKYTAGLLCGIMSMAWVSCVHPPHTDEPAKVVPVPYTFSQNSPSFSQKHVLLNIDSVNHLLRISLLCQFPKNAPFPLNKTYADTLTQTGFLLEFTADGQPVLSAYNSEEAWRTVRGFPGRVDNVDVPLVFKTDTISLLSGSALIELPYYAFHRLKQGVHQVTLRISQHICRSPQPIEVPCYDSVFKHPSTCRILNRAEKQLVYGTVHFKVYVPPLHETMLYSNRIEIKNDSTFNPYTCDNTLWKSPLPDIYWAVYYPTDHYYTSSGYETSTITYTKADTFRVYHYGANDSIGLAVYDHDNLSRDDGLGYKIFCIQDLIRRKGVTTSFDHVKIFSIKAEYKGLVNR